MEMEMEGGQLSVHKDAIHLVLTGKVTFPPATRRQLFGQQEITSLADSSRSIVVSPSCHQTFYAKPQSISETNTPRAIPRTEKRRDLRIRKGGE